MKSTTLFITGTDTGVGKTVLTALLAACLREQGANAAALKPICSGGRDDARALHSAMDGALSLDEINPWHFRAPIAPSLAARKERKSVKPADVLAHIRQMQKRFEVLLVEGAGGLLSPLGEGFDSRDLIVALQAGPLIVCPNRLGVVNQVLLTVEALPRGVAAKARVVLMSPPTPDTSTKTNPDLLGDLLGRERLFLFPWLDGRPDGASPVKNGQAQKVLRALAKTV